MRKTLLIVLTALMAMSFSGCIYLRNTFEYGNDAKNLMKDLMQKDYKKCISLMDQSTSTTKAANDTLTSILDESRNKVLTSFGQNPDYSYLRAQKGGTMSLEPVPNTTTIFLQVSNDTNLGIIEFLVNDKTGKIINFKPWGMKQPIPDMGNFWLFGIITIGVLLFNLYMLWRVKRSDMSKKWLKYLAIIFLNAPSIGYAQTSGVVFLWRVQLFFGVYFVKMGYPSSSWVFGIPLASIYILWQLRTGKYIKAPKKPKAERIKQKLKA